MPMQDVTEMVKTEIVPKDTTWKEFFKIVFALILPPVAVYMTLGFSKQFWLNCILTLFGILPGTLHAIYIIAKY